MSTATATSATTFTHVTTYFADKMLMLLGNIIRDSGLDMAHFTSVRSDLELGIKTWLESGHLKKVTLEIFKPGTTSLIRRWDLEWDKCGSAEAGFWVDIADIKYHMAKLGLIAKSCSYRLLVDRTAGYQLLPGWESVAFADASALKQFSLGATISAGGNVARTTYWK